MPQAVRHCSLLLLVGVVVFFFRLGTPRLWDVDEAIFTETAREMVNRHDLVVPYFNGEMLPDKPALMYWFMIGGFELFGTTEFAARFWSANFALGSLLLTYWLGRRMFSATVGLWAGLMLATCLNFDVIARAATPDSLLVFFATLPLCILVEGTWPRRRAARCDDVIRPSDLEPALRLPPAWRSYALAYAAMGVAALTKGPIGVLLPTAVWGLFLLISGPQSLATDTTALTSASEERWRRALRAIKQTLAPRHFLRTVWQMRPLTAVLAVAIVAGPWYVWVAMRTEGRWPEQFLGVHNVSRFLHPMEGHRGVPFYYVLAIAVGFFPWSTFLAPTFVELRRRIVERRASSPGAVLVVCWIVVWVGFFSLAGTKLPSYIVPAYPAVALATGCFVQRWLTSPRSIAPISMRLAWGFVMLVGLVTMVALPLVSQTYFGDDLLLGAVGLPPLLGGGLALLFTELGHPRRAAATLLAASIALALILFGVGAVRVDRHQNSPELAEVIRANTIGDVPHIGAFHCFRPSLVYYAQQPVVKIISPEQAREFFGSHDNAFLVTTDEWYGQLVQVLPPDVVVLLDSRGFLIQRQILLLGRTTAARPDVASGEAGPPADRAAAPARRK